MYEVGVIFTATYALLFAFVAVQIAVLLYQKHKRMSFKFGFNVLVLFWAALRVFFFGGLTIPSFDFPPLLLYLVFWLPHAIQFATFALLALFFAKVVNFESWSGRLRVPFTAVFLIAVIGVFIIVVVWSVLAANVAATTTTSISDYEAFTVAGVFLVLSCLFVWFGYKLLKLSKWESNRMFMLQPKVTAWINFTLFAIFGSRSVWNFLTGANFVVIYVNQTSVLDSVWTVLIYSAWELFPTCLLLFTIAGGKRGTRTVHEPSYGKFNAIEHITQSPRLGTPSAAQRSLRVGLLNSVPEGPARASSFDGVTSSPQLASSVDREGSFIRDSQGFEAHRSGGNLGLGNTWYGSGNAQGSTPYLPGPVPMWRTALSTSFTSVNSASSFNVGGAAGGSGTSRSPSRSRIADAASRRPPVDRRPTPNSNYGTTDGSAAPPYGHHRQPQNHNRYSGGASGSAGAAAANGEPRRLLPPTGHSGSLLGREVSGGTPGTVETDRMHESVFANRNRYDTPPTSSVPDWGRHADPTHGGRSASTGASTHSGDAASSHPSDSHARAQDRW